MAKDIIKLLLERDPEQRLSLLSFMEMDYYSMED